MNHLDDDDDDDESVQVRTCVDHLQPRGLGGRPGGCHRVGPSRGPAEHRHLGLLGDHPEKRNPIFKETTGYFSLLRLKWYNTY